MEKHMNILSRKLLGIKIQIDNLKSLQFYEF